MKKTKEISSVLTHLNKESVGETQNAYTPDLSTQIYLISASDLTSIIRSSARDVIMELFPSPPRDDPDPPDSLLTVKECCLELRICKVTLYSLIKANKIKSIKIGRRRFVSTQELKRFLKPQKM